MKRLLLLSALSLPISAVAQKLPKKPPNNRGDYSWWGRSLQMPILALLS